MISYVDYGNHDWVEANDIYILPDQAKDVPPQAVQCCLKGLEHLNGPFPSENAPLFEKLFASGKMFVTLTPNIKSVGKNQLKSAPKFCASIQALVQVEDYVKKLNLHGKPVKSANSPNSAESGELSKTKVTQWLTTNYSDRPEGDGASCSKNQVPNPADSMISNDSFQSLSTSNSATSYQDTFDWKLETVKPKIVGDDVESCRLSAATNLSKIYLHLLNGSESRLTILEQEMTNFYMNQPPRSNLPIWEKKVRSLVKGSLVAVKNNGSWYRAETIQQDPFLCQVFLVDYGKEIGVPYVDIQPLVKQFCSDPKMALLCCLSDLEVKDEVKALKALQEIMSSDFYQGYQLIHDQREVNYPFPVYILAQYADNYESGSKETGDFVHLLIMQKLALPNPTKATKKLAISAIESGNSTSTNSVGNDVIMDWDPMASDYQSPENRQLSALLPSDEDRLMKLDQAKICRFYRFNGKCNAGVNCEHKHIQTGDGFHTKQSELRNIVVGTDRQLKLPEIGTRVPIQVTCVRNPDSFFAILPHGAVNLLNSNEVIQYEQNKKSDIMNEFGCLQKSINEYYESSSGSANVWVRTAEVVAVKYDTCWFRARVIDIDEDKPADQTDVQVQLVDFGDVHQICLTQIRKLADQFLLLPFQMIECSLYGIAPPEGQWSMASGQFLHSLIDKKNLIAEIKMRTVDRICINLYVIDSNLKKKESVSQLLIQRNLAKKVTQKVSHQSDMIPG